MARMILTVFAVALTACGTPDERTAVDGSGLPSSDRPILFLENVVSTGNENDELFPALSPDETTLYFVRRVPDGIFTIYRSDYRGGVWSTPRIASFSGSWSDQEPAFSSDGDRLFFTSNRPIRGTEPIAGRDVWVVHRTDRGWSEPAHVGLPVSLPAPEAGSDNRFLGLARGPRMDGRGHLCFWADRPDDSFGHTDIYCSRETDSTFSEPENLGSPPNSEHYETGICFGPEHRYILFSRDCTDCDHAPGASDIYISLAEEGGWSEPRNLGTPVNSPAYDFAPVLSPSGRHLLFTSNRNVDGEGTGRQNIWIVDLTAVLSAVELDRNEK